MKQILIHLDASPRAASRLAYAQRLARRHGAELSALYGVIPSLLATPWANGEGMAAAASVLADLDREQRDRARAVFDKAATQGPLNWIDTGASPLLGLRQHALYADLLVLGQEDERDALTGALPPDLVTATISDTGKPAVVVPAVGAFEAIASRVLIAWKPTREAARAVSAALPWLRLATEVHVASRPEGNIEGDFDHVGALVRMLQAHGVTAAVRSHGIASGDVGQGLLSLAADTGAELLVMGCYGHGRAREWVLGGATRTVLLSMTLPVLMVH
jgi:nucleotide-binding universal stress UspA family protein